MSSAWPARVELGLALVVIAASSVVLVKWVQAFNRESLWIDELTSAIRTSGNGPVHTVTTYSSPNNHVFFNLLNSVTPGAGSVFPPRARLWSIGPVLATLALLVFEFFRRRWYLAGAVLFALFATNGQWNHLVLQARGYGLLGLFAAVMCTAVWRYLENDSTSALAVLGVAAVLGTWTVPSFVLFAGPVWALLLLVTRRRTVLVGGLGALVGIVAVYLPIIDDVRTEMSRYADQWGREYTSASDVAATLSAWLFTPQLLDDHVPGTAILLALVFLALPALALLPGVTPALRRVVVVVLGSVAAFFAANLWLGTAQPRTTAFAAVPVAFTAAALGGALLAQWGSARADGGERRWHALAATATVVVVSLFLLSHASTSARDFRHQPTEDWRSAAAYVERTFPEGMAVANNPPAYPDLRAAYLDSDRTQVGAVDQDGPLASGAAVLYDLGGRQPPHFDFSRYAPVYSEIWVPQYRGQHLRILAAPPIDPRLAGVRVDGSEQALAPLVDRLPSQGPPVLAGPTGDPVVVRVDPEPGTIARSMVLVGNGPMLPVARVDVTPADGGPTFAIDPERVTITANTLSVPLGDRRIAHVDVTLVRPPRLAATAIREVWVYPKR